MPTPNGDYGLPEIRKFFFVDRTGRRNADGSATADEWIKIYVLGMSDNGRDLNNSYLEGIQGRFEKMPQAMRKPHIINMSLVYTPTNSGTVPLENLPEWFKASLVVVSAGNGRPGAELQAGTNGQYPAMANPNLGNLIVVGSHDADGKKSYFSYYHSERVTLAAPGCAIMSWFEGQGMATPANGTSQAAALVSFAAALLKSHWPDAINPRALRERLIVSSRFSKDLNEGCPTVGEKTGACVRFGSMLDIEMALYYDTDAIEYCIDEGGKAGSCNTRVALGTLTGVPAKLARCAGNYLVRADNDEPTGLSRPAAMRLVEDGQFQVIYRTSRLGAERLDTMHCERIDVSGDEFALRPDADQPDGPLGSETLTLPVSRVVRVVTRSTPLVD